MEERVPIVEFKNVNKIYELGGTTIKASNNLNFKVYKNEFCVIVGPSGSGKTTILNLLGGMDNVTNGSIIVDKEDISTFNDKKLTYYRRDSVGFVFQFYNLMPNLTALDNVEIAAEICKDHLDCQKVLSDVGLKDRMNNFPSQLSGGEQQRVSIARAIAKNPKLLLCDEPTGALDYQTGKMILQLLFDICKQNNKTVIIITHNSALTAMADHVIHLKNGEVIEEEFNDKPTPISEIDW